MIILQNYLIEREGFELTPKMIQHYDLDGDGKVSLSDYAKLATYLGLLQN